MNLLAQAKFIHYMIIVILLSPFLAVGQVIRPSSPENEVARFQYLDDVESNWLNSFIIYDDSTDNKFLQRKNTKFGIISPELALHYNSAIPYGFNDGYVWKGKGLTNEFSTGVYGNLGNFYYTISPVLLYAQNSSFRLAEQRINNISPFNYQFTVGGGIDFVQRYGNNSFVDIAAGQSEIRYLKGYFTAAFSTANFTLGPSTVNPILLSSQAEGFPHLEIGTSKFIPLKWKNIQLGKIKGSLYYGQLKESDFFDENSENDKRYFTALTFSYVVPYVNWLRLGFNRSFYQDQQFFELVDLTRPLLYFGDEGVILPNGAFINDRFDQLASFFVEWTFPKANFRGYIEFSKNDFNGSLRNLLVDFEHSRAFTIGIDKKFKTEKTDVLLTVEHTNLARSRSFLFRPEPPYFIHTFVRQGYTNNGQILGSGIGPGSGSTYLSVSLLQETKLIKLGFQRIQYNDDFFSENFGVRIPPNFDNKDLRNAEYSFFGNYSKIKGQWRYGADLRLTARLNEFYELRNDIFNAYLGISLKRNL